MKDLYSIQCITDAVIMVKSQFISTYKVYGHSIDVLGELWHTHRTSNKGREIKKQTGSVVNWVQPDTEPKRALPQITPIEKVEITSTSKGLSKSQQIRQLYDEGIIDVATIAKHIGAHYSQVSTVIKKYTSG